MEVAARAPVCRLAALCNEGGRGPAGGRLDVLILHQPDSRPRNQGRAEPASELPCAPERLGRRRCECRRRRLVRARKLPNHLRRRLLPDLLCSLHQHIRRRRAAGAERLEPTAHELDPVRPEQDARLVAERVEGRASPEEVDVLREVEEDGVGEQDEREEDRQVCGRAGSKRDVSTA